MAQKSPTRIRSLAWLWGPAFVASVAYVDPGNVAANLTSGARFGYKLIWVLVLANTIAVLVQYLSAKLGLVTGKSLSKLLGERTRRSTRLAYFAQAEIVAITTDLAEVIGGAIALEILFGVPLLLGGIIVGVVSFGLLAWQSKRGQRSFERVIIGLLLIITIGFLAGVFVSGVQWGQAAQGLIPSFSGRESVLLAASMLGATVMPHAIYAHSSLAVDRHGPRASMDMPATLRSTRWEVLVSLFFAGGVNILMLVLAASALSGVPGTDSIQGAHRAIETNLGPVVGALFAIGLLASGLASTSVGAYAGVTIMRDLLKRKVPVIVMRLITLVPALIILAIGVDPTWALVLSQVVLSFGIPFALIPLVRYTSSRFLGQYASKPMLTVISWLAVGAIVVLNLMLVILLITG
ncbi:MAG: Nramp family divalent metal transporter [Propionibacteriaceae bacterium]|jgi:manganese transport protein|nr:Nramp family divalent metal transporter [Propionibacteriaceae bacterium]